MFIAGDTFSSDLHEPGWVGYDQVLDGASDAFAIRFNPAAGIPTYSTFIGGSDWDGSNLASLEARLTSIAVRENHAFVVGNTLSADFFSSYVKNPAVEAAAYDSILNAGNTDKGDAFLVRLDAAGAPTYATFFGGSNSDYGTAVHVAGANTVFVAGYTFSGDLPTVGPATSLQGGIHGFVVRFNLPSKILVFSRYLGGSESERIWGLGGGMPLVTGWTDSTLDFPVTVGAYDTTSNGGRDAFVTRLDADGDLSYSSYLGGSESDEGRAILAFKKTLELVPANLYIAGYTSSGDFPFTLTSHNGGMDAFVSVIDPGGSFFQPEDYLG